MPLIFNVNSIDFLRNSKFPGGNSVPKLKLKSTGKT